MLKSYGFLGFAVLVLYFTSAYSDGQMLVFPRLLEGRGLNGEKILKINDDLTLKLARTSVFPEKLLIRTFKNGSLVNRYVEGAIHNEHMYHDTEQMAAVILHEDDGVHVEGLLRHDLRIKPMPHMERSLEGHVAHMLHPVKQRAPYSVDHGHPPNQYSSYFREINSSPTPVEERSSSIIFPEVHFVMDSAACLAYGYDENEITKYLSVMVMGVNLRYRSVTHPNVSLVIVAITLAQVGYEPYMRYYQHKTDMIFFDQTLTAFMNHYQGDSKYWEADIYFMITGRDLVGVATDGTLLREFSGYAFLSSACTHYKVGISEDEPKSYDGVHLLAHEVAHLLGCTHDGDGADLNLPGHPGSTKCPWDDGYIMSYVINFKNHFTFSSCCIQSIQFVSTKRKCLHEFNANKNVTSIKSLPGLMISPSQFCKFLHPLYRGVHAEKKGVARNCIQKCRTAYDRRRGYEGWTHAALDGTRCSSRDEKKACINGRCKSLKEKPRRYYEEE